MESVTKRSHPARELRGSGDGGWDICNGFYVDGIVIMTGVIGQPTT